MQPSSECRRAATPIMPQQPNLFSREPGGLPPNEADGRQPLPGSLASGQPPGSASGGRGRRGARRSGGATVWLARTELLVRVIVRLYLGLLILVLPWMRFWSENALFGYSRVTEVLAASGFVRGVVSGLGLLNVAMAFKELFLPERRG